MPCFCPGRHLQLVAEPNSARCRLAVVSLKWQMANEKFHCANVSCIVQRSYWPKHARTAIGGRPVGWSDLHILHGVRFTTLCRHRQLIGSHLGASHRMNLGGSSFLRNGERPVFSHPRNLEIQKTLEESGGQVSYCGSCRSSKVSK